MLYTLPNGNAINLLDVRGVSCDESRYSAALQKCMAARVVIRTGLEHHDVSIVEFVDDPEEAAVFRDELIKLVNQAQLNAAGQKSGPESTKPQILRLTELLAEMGVGCSVDWEVGRVRLHGGGPTFCFPSGDGAVVAVRHDDL